ncbi:MAG: GNAT family N-acetyltransferase [Clostridia bacterium]|nr:GNAT family N-acetyltransferase [Clostridia bacterium]
MGNTLTTEFRLRPLEPKDADRMLEWMRDADATRYLHIGGEKTSYQDVSAFIEHASEREDTLHRAVVNSDDIYLGTISLKNISKERGDAEYAVAMHPDAWGTGASKAATEQILSYAFDTLKLDRVYLNVFAQNGRANRFYQKAGFQQYAATEVKVGDEIKKLNWYEIKKNQQYLLPIDTKVVLYSAIKVPFGGGRTLLLDLADYLSKEMGYETYYIVPTTGEIEQAYLRTACERLHVLTEDETDFTAFEGAVFFTATNHLSHLLTKINMLKSARILLYFGHPDILAWYKNQFPVFKLDVRSFLEMVWKTNSATFQDQSNLLVINKQSARPFLPDYVPTITHAPDIDLSTIQRGKKPGVIRMLWMGRLDYDKIWSLINCLDHILSADIEEKVEFHIIGDGNARDEIIDSKYAPKIQLIFTSSLYGKVRDRYIMENADLVMSMGISAMDCALFGIPAVIPIVSEEPFDDDRYVYIQDVPNYSLGWTRSEIDELGCATHSIEEVIKMVCRDEETAYRIGMEGKMACERMFNAENAGKLLLHALSNTKLTPQKCLEFSSIKKQMLLYNMYSKLRHKRSFTSFLTRLGWIRGEKEDTGIRRLLVIPRIVKLLFEKLLKRKKAEKLSVSELIQIQNEYPAKLKTIQAACKETGVIKVAFLNLYRGVFPFQAVFEKMLDDPAFDPWIIVIPNMIRSEEYRNSNYAATYQSLSEQYGNRVLHGYDLEKGIVHELGDTYQVICFNNPYDNQVHHFHSAGDWIKKPVLTMYANYGFAALNYWSEVIHTDFFNEMWKVCVETESNMKYLQENEPIKGRNGFLTGYIKMDSMANCKPSKRERKKILICPHHTVWGWKTLSISNFIQYADLFLRLPERFPEIDFIFRPHPLLFENLVAHNVWTQEEVKDYISYLKSIPNLVYDQSGDYFQTFVDSDAMIHDCGSFIGEYLYTEKPCCYMMQSEEKTRETLLPTGIACMDQYYHAFNEQDIMDFIQKVVIDGDDPMKHQREQFSRSELKKYYPNAANRVIELLKQEILKKGE